MALERLKYIFAVFLYGTIGMFLRFVNLPSEVVAMCRGAFGAAFILLYLTVRGQKLDRKAIRENRKWLVIGGICLGLNWIFLFAAYISTTVAIASLCNYMAPIIVILIAPLVLGEKLDKRKMPCVAAAFVGIILVSGVWSGSIGSPFGVVMGLLASMGFVGVIISNRKLHDIAALERVVIQMAVSVCVMLPYVLARNIGTPIHLDLRSVLIVLMLGILHTGVAYCFYFSGMGHLPVQTVAILGYLEPVVSVLCSTIFLHEAMGMAGWIGAALIVGACIVSESLPE